MTIEGKPGTNLTEQQMTSITNSMISPETDRQKYKLLALDFGNQDASEIDTYMADTEQPTTTH